MKISLAQQIDEINRELGQRRIVYPSLVARGTMRPSIAEFQVNRLTAARDTLLWLQANELTIKQRLSQ